MGTARAHIERSLGPWHTGDFATVRTTMADGMVWVTPSDTFTGADAVLERYRSDHAAFPDRRIDPSAWVEDGDTVVMEYQWSGTHDGPLALPDGTRLDPTGQQITLRCLDLFEVRDGKTISHRSYWDQLSSLAQLGLVPPPS
ncbi:MAG: ester cyclase [Dermatophilaceae bacterium]